MQIWETEIQVWEVEIQIWEVEIQIWEVEKKIWEEDIQIWKAEMQGWNTKKSFGRKGTLIKFDYLNLLYRCFFYLKTKNRFDPNLTHE